MKKVVLSAIALLGAVSSTMGQEHEKYFSSEIEVLVSLSLRNFRHQVCYVPSVSDSILSHKIQSPAWMQGKLDHRGALFGPFPAGESVQAQLFYTTRQLCGDETPNTPESIKKNGYFLMVDRGGCSFVEKVRNAQKDNATAVIIADSHCVCGEDNMCVDDSTQACEDVVPVLDDDGSGSDITIPSFMIYKPDGELFKEQLVRGTDIEINLSWPMPQAVNGRTEFVLWTTPDDIMSYQFLSTFESAAKELYDNVLFKPKMFVKDGTEKGCRKYDTGDDPCPGFCTNYGRYCPSRLYDFDQYDDKGIKMVVESLRRTCIWAVYGEKDGVGQQWWRYNEAWIHMCSSGSHYSAECAQAAYASAGIDGNLVEQCMEQSGNFRHDTENVLLDNFIIEAAEFDVTFAPSLYVNEAVVRGALTYGSAMNAICATFDPTTAPPLCAQWKICEKDCPVGKSCYINYSQQCTVYKPPFLESGVDYDDDFIFESREPTLAPSSIRTYAPTKLTTYRPTSQPSDPETNRPTTMAPSGQQSTVANSPPTPKYTSGSETVNETVQIFEGRGGPDAALVIGLSVGLGFAFFCSVLFFLYMRDRRRQVEMCQIAMDDGRGLLANNFNDDDSFGGRFSWKSRRSRQSRNPRHHDDDEFDSGSRRRSIRRFLRRPKSRRQRYEPRPTLRPKQVNLHDWDDESPDEIEFDSVQLMRGDYDADIINRERTPITREPRSRHYPREFIVDDDSLEDEYD